MALLTKPNMQQIWASGGDIVEPSDLKKQQGWTVEVPPHQFENWIQNRQDEYLAHINQRGIPTWDALTEYEAGGLSYVQGSDGTIYKSVAASGPSTVTQNPTTDVSDTYWAVAFSNKGEAYTKAESDSNFLAKTQNLNDLPNKATARTNLSVYSQSQVDALIAAIGQNLPLGYLSGFTLANDGVSPNTTLSVTSGTARSSDNTVDISLTGTLRGILQASGSWTAGDNQNKLDTGAKAINSWYHVFAIRKTSDGTGDILFSLSPTAPTMPSGYAGFRRISAIRTDASGNIIQFLNFGRNFTFKTPILDVDIAAAIVDAAYVLSVPTGIEVKVKVGMFCSGGDASWSYRSPSANAIVPSHTDYRGGSLLVTTENPDRLAVDTEIVTNASAQIHFRTALSSAFRVVTYGWTEL